MEAAQGLAGTEVTFLTAALPSAVLCIGSWNGVGNTNSVLAAASALCPQHCHNSKCQRSGRGQKAGKGQSQEADSGDIAYHGALSSVMKAQRNEETEGAFAIEAFVLARDG